jgi:hypothetical protein
MPKKSGFLIFLLSFVPGLAHVYVGAKERAIRFGLMFWGVVALNVIMQQFYWRVNIFDMFMGLSCIYLPIVALLAMIDAFKINNLRPHMTEDELDLGMQALGELKISRRATAAVLSLVPGLGHLYLGLKNQGLSFLLGFFGVSAVCNSFNISVLEFILPVLWFYAIFDAWHRADAENQEAWDNGKGLNINWHKWVGWALIVIGVLSLGQLGWDPLMHRLAELAESFGYLWDEYYVSNMIRTVILAVVFVIGGIVILVRGTGKKQLPEKDNREEEI